MKDSIQRSGVSPIIALREFVKLFVPSQFVKILSPCKK